MAAINNVNKAIATLVEETAVSTVDKLVVYLGEKIEVDDDLKQLFEDFKKTTREEIKAAYKPAGKGSKKATAAGGAEKKKREPSAYNLFIKEKMAQIKAKRPELKGKDLMKEAIVEWKARPNAA